MENRKVGNTHRIHWKHAAQWVRHFTKSSIWHSSAAVGVRKLLWNTEVDNTLSTWEWRIFMIRNRPGTSSELFSVITPALPKNSVFFKSGVWLRLPWSVGVIIHVGRGKLFKRSPRNFTESWKGAVKGARKSCSLISRCRYQLFQIAVGKPSGTKGISPFGGCTFAPRFYHLAMNLPSKSIILSQRELGTGWERGMCGWRFCPPHPPPQGSLSNIWTYFWLA